MDFPTNQYQEFGQIIHQVLENAYTKKFKTRNDLIREFYKLAKGTQVNKAPFLKDAQQLMFQFPMNELSNQVVDVEYRFKIPVTEDINLVGVIDRIDIIDDDTLLITDYKTNKAMDLKDYVLQMQLYNYAIKCSFPEYKKRILDWYYLRFNKHNQVVVPDKVNDKIKNFCVNIVNDMNNETVWTKNKNQYCGFCPMKEKCFG